MLMLKEILSHSAKLAAIAALLGLVACGGGGGGGNELGIGVNDEVLCGSEPCPSGDDGDDAGSDSDDIDNIEDQGTPDSIEFVLATPSQISIQGAGGDETSVVNFLVTDTGGDPIEGVVVTFALDNTVGGIALSNSSDTTNAAGVASAIVQAGTSATSVRVIATVPSLSFQTSSDPIVISTGLADYDSFTLAVSLRAAHAWDFVGTQVAVTARASDVFNNPAPDGTQVSFYTEGGQIGASCVLSGGGCSVQWTGQNPRAIEGIRQGRSEIMAVVTGAESFNDVNSNGVFDDGDGFDTTSGYDTQDDRPEPWLDINENGIYDSGEFFVDLNNNSTWDDQNNLYDGPLCTHSTLCSDRKSIAISQSNLIVMAGGVPYVTSNIPGTVNVSGGPATYTINVADVNGGTLPGGSTFTIETSNGEIVGATNFEFNNFGTESMTVSFTIQTDGTPSADGALSLSITTPSGDYSVTFASVVD